MKTTHILLGLAALAGGAYLWHRSAQNGAVKAVDVKTPATTVKLGASAVAATATSLVAKLKALTSTKSPAPAASSAVPTTARAADRPPTLAQSNQVQLT